VLLTADKSGQLTAKITDFGLSRKLYHEPAYWKKGEVLFLWIQYKASFINFLLLLSEFGFNRI